MKKKNKHKIMIIRKQKRSQMYQIPNFCFSTAKKIQFKIPVQKTKQDQTNQTKTSSHQTGFVILTLFEIKSAAFDS